MLFPIFFWYFLKKVCENRSSIADYTAQLCSHSNIFCCKIGQLWTNIVLASWTQTRSLFVHDSSDIHLLKIIINKVTSQFWICIDSKSVPYTYLHIFCPTRLDAWFYPIIGDTGHVIQTFWTKVYLSSMLLFGGACVRMRGSRVELG